jgi:hypothetical protein
MHIFKITNDILATYFCNFYFLAKQYLLIFVLFPLMIAMTYNCYYDVTKRKLSKLRKKKPNIMFYLLRFDIIIFCKENFLITNCISDLTESTPSYLSMSVFIKSTQSLVCLILSRKCLSFLVF